MTYPLAIAVLGISLTILGIFWKYFDTRKFPEIHEKKFLEYEKRIETKIEEYKTEMTNEDHSVDKRLAVLETEIKFIKEFITAINEKIDKFLERGK